jgi:soluble lytic murein transglycosylase-like protein
MSAQALTTAPLGSTVPSGALAATQRVQELQEMIAEARQGSSTTSFASALNAATATTPSAAPVTTGFSGSVPMSAELTSTMAAASAPGSTQEGSSNYDSLIEQSAARNGVDPAILHGLIQQESGFDPNSHSSAGALGLTQLMPGTASSLGVSNPLDPAQSIEGGARYLSQMLSKFGGNISDALAAYNAGPGAVQRYGGVPPYAETQDYVSKVLGYANAYRQSQPSAGATSPIGNATGSIT